MDDPVCEDIQRSIIHMLPLSTLYGLQKVSKLWRDEINNMIISTYRSFNKLKYTGLGYEVYTCGYDYDIASNVLQIDNHDHDIILESGELSCHDRTSYISFSIIGLMKLIRDPTLETFHVRTWLPATNGCSISVKTPMDFEDIKYTFKITIPTDKFRAMMRQLIDDHALVCAYKSL